MRPQRSLRRRWDGVELICSVFWKKLTYLLPSYVLVFRTPTNYLSRGFETEVLKKLTL